MFTIKKLVKPKNYFQHRFIYEAVKGEISKGFEIDHINNCRSDNQIKNLQLLNHQQNIEKSKNKKTISINIENSKKKIHISIKSASIDLNINASHTSEICNQIKHRKSATSKNNGQKYRFEFLK